MRKIAILFILLVSTSVLQATAADITFTEDDIIQAGDSYNYAYLYNGGTGQTTVEMTGGSVYALVLYDDSQFIKNGGDIQDFASIWDMSTLSVYAATGGEIYTHETSTFNLYEGVIGSIDMNNESIANIYGGIVSAFQVRAGTTLNISGGDFSPSPTIGEGGTINVYYYSREDAGVRYSGILPDGSPFLLSKVFNYYQVEPNYVLTIQTDPNDLNTVTQSVNRYDIQEECFFYNITAEPFVDCPEVYRFDHWDGIGVLDPNSPNTEVSMISDKTITALFVATRECGDECHPNDNFGDYNNDCIIDIIDFSEFAYNWLLCTKPECD